MLNRSGGTVLQNLADAVSDLFRRFLPKTLDVHDTRHKVELSLESAVDVVLDHFSVGEFHRQTVNIHLQ